MYQPENREPDILSRKCFKSLSRGGRPEVACDTFEQRDIVELDLDMVEEGAGGNLSTSKLFEDVLFLPRSGVERGVAVSEISEVESDNFDWYKEEM